MRTGTALFDRARETHLLAYNRAKRRKATDRAEFHAAMLGIFYMINGCQRALRLALLAQGRQGSMRFNIFFCLLKVYEKRLWEFPVIRMRFFTTVTS